MSEHTPGPWVPGSNWFNNSDSSIIVRSRATAGHGMVACRIRSQADARLIAAAPEMLRCLKWLRDDIKQKIHPLHPNDDWLSPALREIESAISAATETLTTAGKEGEVR
jgi:hypothetical protein